jgi:hypothetical protein
MRRLIANWLWLLVFGALVIGFIVGGWSASNEAPRQQAERTESASDGADKTPPPVSQMHTEQKTARAEDREGHSPQSWLTSFFELKLTDVVIAFFTVVLAIKTSGLFTETAGLRSAADKQSRDMEASIKVAQKAADAAQKAADVSEAALIVAERPYLISAEPKLKIYRFGQPGMPPSEPPEWDARLEYSFQNIGRSVGFLKEVTAELLFAEELPLQPKFSAVGVAGVRIVLGHYPIGLEKTYACPTYGIKEHINAPMFANIKGGKLKQFFFGYARYTDIFGYLHTDGFCFLFTKIGDGANVQSECAAAGGNNYNFSRREKIPSSGYENPAFQPGGASEADLARINKIASG